ncbi:MAG: sigma 54-interacting transcriptional regulator [Gammaproteobacteria bacterium]|nr:sigma 54-interacting transcriptional regulator [Gammaproteobacteria bacterium]
MTNIKQYLADSDLLLNAVGEGIYGFDLQGHAVFVNPAAEQMTGWQAAELLGKNIHQYHHHSHADGSPHLSSDCKIYGTLHDGISRKVSGEVFWRKDGSHFSVEYTTTAVYKEGVIIGVVAVFRDVSEQIEAQLSLRQALTQVQQLTEQLQAENTYLQSELQQQWSADGLVGNSKPFKLMTEQLALVASTNSTVLILGESGTGKEVVARNIHRLSQRSQSTMVKVNCAAFTASLLESELFGHEKGAFTGAIERRKGRFELANNGTLFLDEIGELSLAAQSKLLRVLQEQEFERVGGTATIKVDIRIIAATNRNLTQMVSDGLFRMDLFYRLNVFPIVLPPLRQRIGDIEELSHSIIAKLNKKLAKKIVAISDKTLTTFKQYSWPGNIRELQNVLERELILATGDSLELKTPLIDRHSNEIVSLCSLSDTEKSYLIQVLKHCRWKIGGVDGAAVILKLPESTLRSKMKKLKISRPT